MVRIKRAAKNIQGEFIFQIAFPAASTGSILNQLFISTAFLHQN